MSKEKSCAIAIFCKCGHRLWLDFRLHQLWERRGIKFKCAICNAWVEGPKQRKLF